MYKILFLFAVASCVVIATDSNLEQVSDDELLNLFRSENYVVVLFSKKACPECDALEKALVNIREDIVETVGAWVVKALDSQLVKLYSPTKEPALVFFRHGVPLLYDGDVNDELILHTLTDNKEPIVKELTDETFEHLTQASSGATTGDWFVMFYSNDCVDCVRMQARWEAVGARLKSRMNIARVNKGTAGKVTARRFRISEVPYFIFFRHGNMYHYSIQKYDVKSFVSFASDWYRKGKTEKVPIPKAPFDDLTLMIADYLKENSWLWQLFGVSLVLGTLLALYTRNKQIRMEAEARSKQEAKEKVKKSK